VFSGSETRDGQKHGVCNAYYIHCDPTSSFYFCYNFKGNCKPIWIIAHTDNSRGSKAFSSVCLSVILYVCVCVSALPLNNKWPQSLQIWYILQVVFGLKGQRVIKCKNILKAIEWLAWVMHFIECPASSSSIAITRKLLFSYQAIINTSTSPIMFS